MRSRSGLMTSRPLSWQANAVRPIGQSAYRRVIKTTEIGDSSKKQTKKLKKINENVFIDVIFRNEEKIARIDRVGLRPGFILAILPPPAVRVVCESL